LIEQYNYGIVLVFDWTVYGIVLVFDWTVYGIVDIILFLKLYIYWILHEVSFHIHLSNIAFYKSQ